MSHGNFFFIWHLFYSIWSSSVELMEGGSQSTSMGNSFSCETICWVWTWNLARPSNNLFNWKTMSWKCLLSRSSNLTRTSERRAANCFLARERHFRTSLKLVKQVHRSMEIGKIGKVREKKEKKKKKKIFVLTYIHNFQPLLGKEAHQQTHRRPPRRPFPWLWDKMTGTRTWCLRISW